MVRELAERCREASAQLRLASTARKNDALEQFALLLEQNKGRILEENQKDITAARADGMSEALLDRLALTEKRIGSARFGRFCPTQTRRAARTVRCATRTEC